MLTIQEIEQAVLKLSPSELASFREWFDELDAEIWDKQFEMDVKSGKLDELANQAIADFQSGKCKEL
ncbi:MAG: hypothetical protein QG588_1651 [Candidatus Poribacteria bacterium]|nr:hypothetical protein [Candidatus Poribacteria bacterium]